MENDQVTLRERALGCVCLSGPIPPQAAAACGGFFGLRFVRCHTKCMICMI